MIKKNNQIKTDLFTDPINSIDLGYSTKKKLRVCFNNDKKNNQTKTDKMF